MHERSLSRAVFAVALGLASASALAGKETTYAACSVNADGSGICWGSLKGFQTHPDPEAEFYLGDSHPGGYRWFQASLDGGKYSCVLWESSAPASLLERWNRALVASGYIHVEWDASGTCTDVHVINASSFPRY